MSKKVLIYVTIFFFSAMLFLSIFAESIHNADLPKVTAERPVTRLFSESITDENGETISFSTEKIVLTREQLGHDVFVLYTAVKNGTERTLVRKIVVITGAEKDGYVEILSGLMPHEKVVVSSTAELYDGCEVTII